MLLYIHGGDNMTISKDKARYSITLMGSTYNIIDYVAKETNKTRSEVIEALVTFSITHIDNLADMVEYVKEN